MRVQIVGIQKQNYTLEGGYSFNGNKIHAIDKDTVTDGQLGEQVTTFKIASNHPLASVPLAVGEEYTVYFNQKGALDFISKIK